MRPAAGSLLVSLLVLSASGFAAIARSPHGVQERLHAWDLLHQKKFAELNQMVGAFQADFEKDYHQEQALAQVIGVFSIGDVSLEPLYTAWIQQYPNSWAPHLAHGCYLKARGYAARGTDVADKTTEQQFRNMQAYLDRASMELRAALKLNPKAIYAYDCLLDVDRASADDASAAQHIREALQLCPACYIVRRAYLDTLTPRWGGSYAQMRRFAEDAQKYAAVNPKIKLLPGFVFREMALDLEDDKSYQEAIPLLTRALSYGDHSSFYFYRAEAYKALEQYYKALPDLNHAIALEPTRPVYFRERSIVQAELLNYEAALADVRAARNLAPNDSWLAQWEQRLQSDAGSSGPGGRPPGR